MNAIAKGKLSSLHCQWGTALFNTADYEPAITEFTHAIAHHGGVAEYFFYRARALIAIGVCCFLQIQS
jgi:hypothetical protein